MPDQPIHHEVCVCGHCRCEHAAAYRGCRNCNCIRYTWPGPGSDLQPDHRPGLNFGAKVGK